MSLESKLNHYGLSYEEYQRACALLKKEDLENLEWALFSSLWSEHCSYKSSKAHLKDIYNESEKIVSEEGENAGVVDLGMGEKIAFKMESHNHPSFIEPFQGAATGVGGILRDIFTMGARPIALANYLCFGEAGSERLSHLVDGVVSGISFYGNCVGVPNITGQTEFLKTYNKNNLVNAFALGYFGEGEKIVSSKVKNPGDLVVYVGAKTGRDGVHGASMASASFDEESESKRPTVQIGDPFYEKCLIESCLEVMRAGLVEAVQDMGAAGLTSSSFEMSYGGGLGLELDLSKVPLRDATMTAEEILLSESQERMLLTCKSENLEAIKKVFYKWGLEAVEIGKVREEKAMRLLWNGEIAVEIEADLIVGKAPRYEREFAEDYKSSKKEGASSAAGLDQVCESLDGASKSWIYQQYDQRVGARTLQDCSSQFGAVLLPQSQRPVGVALGCSPLLMSLDAQVGGADSFLYPALAMSAKGYQPWAVTDCLNFGNPEKKEIMTQFVHSLRSLSAACETFEAPIISGNVSLYNETENQNITPTPATAVVGLYPKAVDEAVIVKDVFQKAGSQVYLLELKQVQWSGYRSYVSGGESWLTGEIDLPKALEFSKELIELAQSGKLLSSRLVGRFGVEYALSKMVDSKGFDLSSSFAENKLKEEVLYQVIVELKEGEELSFASASIYELGSVTEKAELSLKDQSYAPQDLKEKSQQSWRTQIGLG